MFFFAWSRIGKQKNWKKLHVGNLRNGISCQHLQVMENKLPQKHCEWQDDKAPMLRQGSVVRPTTHQASMDVKTALDEAKPRHVAKIMENRDTHGWLIAAFLREMLGLEGKAMFECESSFVFN